MITVEAGARQTVVAMLAFLAEGDMRNAHLVLNTFLMDVGPLIGPTAALQHVAAASFGVALQLGDAETFRSLAGAMATSEG